MSYAGLLQIYLTDVTVRVYLSDQDTVLRDTLDRKRQAVQDGAKAPSRSEFCAKLLRESLPSSSDSLLVEKVKQIAKSEGRSFSSMVKRILEGALNDVSSSH